ncbi:MAG: DUF1573 domain-containing protein [Phycisphaerales bacterium]|nr:DUF1573 domain-containing protein [Phycisphaerales bacterium]
MRSLRTRSLSLSILLALSAGTPLGVPSPAIALQPASDRPVKLLTGDGTLTFPQPSIDLGVHPDTQPIFHTFSFSNTSKQRVKLEITFCHFCTPPTLDKTELDPGESGTLLIEINPAGRTGEMRANATVAVAGSPASAVMVEAKAEIRPRVWVQPVQFFPRIIRGDNTTLNAEVTGRSADFAVTRIESDTQGISATATAPVTLPDPTGGKLYQSTIAIAFSNDLPLGPIAAKLHVHTTDRESDAKLITIQGELVGRITCTPPRTSRTLFAGAVWGAVFELTSATGPLQIESAEMLARDEAQSIALDVIPSPDPSKVWVMISGIAPLREREACDLQAAITARSGPQGELETITIPIVLMVRPPQ